MEALAGRWKKLLQFLKSRMAVSLRRAHNGQSMVEYALIGVLVALAIGTTIILTKGTIGNVFSNTVYNLLQASTTPYVPPDSSTLNAYGTAFFALQPPPSPFQTNTPAAPTCIPVGSTPIYAVTQVAPNNGTFVPC
jgi:Flp pilus assembly pilin Flp